jgi:catechol 2,3-dioxygenase-like lactoylglutathione lyase family enzyme
MGVSRLEHVNIRCADVRATRDFYVGLLGLTEGPRPDFPFRGFWLYLGDVPVVHLMAAADKGATWSHGDGAVNDAPGSGRLDHVAFKATDFEEMRDRLQAAGATFREKIVPGDRLRQLFVPDPEGVLVELNFEI